MLIVGGLLLLSFQFILIRNYVDQVCNGVPYMSEHKPGKKPVIFCHKIISTDDHDEYGIHFSSDAKTLYFVRRLKDGPMIMQSGQGLYGWTKPRKILFKDEFALRESCFTTDEKKLLLVHSLKNGQADGLYISTKESGNWSIPERLTDSLLGPEIGSLSVSQKGNVFYSGKTKEKDLSDILITEYRNKQYMPPWNPGSHINTGYQEKDPFIAPDESYLLFCSDRPGGYGGTDLYISTRATDGQWGPAINLGPSVNTARDEGAPYMSPDGQYLFFSREKNGNKDIYWVSSRAIEVGPALAFTN
jgi:hypothetical protein